MNKTATKLNDVGIRRNGLAKIHALFPQLWATLADVTREYGAYKRKVEAKEGEEALNAAAAAAGGNGLVFKVEGELSATSGTPERGAPGTLGTGTPGNGVKSAATISGVAGTSTLAVGTDESGKKRKREDAAKRQKKKRTGEAGAVEAAITILGTPGAIGTAAASTTTTTKNPRKPRSPKLDENGNPIARKSKQPRLDEQGNPIPPKSKSRAAGATTTANTSPVPSTAVVGVKTLTGMSAIQPATLSSATIKPASTSRKRQSKTVWPDAVPPAVSKPTTSRRRSVKMADPVVDFTVAEVPLAGGSMTADPNRFPSGLLPALPVFDPQVGLGE